MDKSTLSNYGWIVIVTLVLAVMLALATPFGTFVGKGASNVIKTFVQSSDNAVDEDNIDTQSKDWESYLYNDKYTHKGIIPEGGKYTSLNGDVFVEGDKFPEAMKDDIYEYGDYTYKLLSDGWYAKTVDKSKEYYSIILLEINNQPTTAIRTIYKDCVNLVGFEEGWVLPAVENYSGIFMNCTSLKTLPDNTTFITGGTYTSCFANCTSLEKLPDNFKFNTEKYCDFNSTFESCTNLKSIPSGCIINARILNRTFQNCYSLTGTITINSDDMLGCVKVLETDSPSQNIVLKGNAPNLQEVANTSTAGMRTVTIA